jgi:ribonuclease VapC
MVVDSSVILSILLNDEHAVWCAAKLQQHAGGLKMSVVNVTEVLIILKDSQPKLFPALQQDVLAMPILYADVTFDDAKVAAAARVTFPLNLGDCYAYALAKRQGDSIISTDSDFRNLDIPTIVPTRSRE